MVHNVKIYVVPKLDMYELVMDTTNENGEYDLLQCNPYVLYRYHMYNRKESTWSTTISNGDKRR